MFVISPWAFKLWLEEYADVQDFGLEKLVFINNEDILYNKYKEASSMQRYFLWTTSTTCKSITN
jgi:hypothetical protein